MISYDRAVATSRDRAYADLLLDTCLGVQPGWQVLVVGTPLGRPLLEELIGGLARRGAYALPRITFTGRVALQDLGWALEAPLERLAQPAPLEEEALRTCDALVAVDAPENTRAVAALAPERMQALQGAYRPALERVMSHEVPWVGCQYPTPALAQDAGMSTAAFAEFLYGACLRDWDAERERMRRHADRFDRAREVRIVGEGTDLRLGLEGRAMKVDAAGSNMPGGEFFGCPVEGTASGVIAFSEFPATFAGRDIDGRAPALRGRRGGRRERRDERGVPPGDPRSRRRVRAAWASSGSAATPGSRATCATPCSTRRWTGRSTSRSATATTTSAAPTCRPSTGTSSRTCGAAAGLELDGVVVQQDGAWLAG